MLIKKQWEYLKELCGNKCMYPDCEITDNLEFAHLKDTGLSGMSRGRKERYYNIIKNLDSYILLCEEHHKMMDDYLKDNKEEFINMNLIPLIDMETMKNRFR